MFLFFIFTYRYRLIWVVNLRDYSHFLQTFQFLVYSIQNREWYIPFILNTDLMIELGLDFRTLSETWKHAWKSIFRVRNKCLCLFKFLLYCHVHFFQNKFTCNSRKSKTAIQSVPNKSDVLGITFDLEVKFDLKLNSTLKFSFYLDTPLGIFGTTQPMSFHVCSFTIEMPLPVYNNNFTVCPFIFVFRYFLLSPFSIFALW